MTQFIDEVRCYNVRAAVRLAGNGSSAQQGRLEVFYSGQWGTVCSDFFDYIDAAVACYSLGFGFVFIAFSQISLKT